MPENPCGPVNRIGGRRAMWIGPAPRLMASRHASSCPQSLIFVSFSRKDAIQTKIRKLSNGSTRGGVPFTQGPLFYLLRNRRAASARHRRRHLA